MNVRVLVVSILLALLLAMIPVLNIGTAQAGTITIAVDLGHGEKDKYLNYIMGNITQVTIDGKTYSINWVTIGNNTPITPSLLANVDVLLIGQPTTGFTPDEMNAILEWLKKGNKALYVAGDSDYGSGPASISAVNDLLEYIGVKLRLEHAGVYSDPSYTYTYKGNDYPTCTGAYYRMVAFVEPDNIPSLFTDILSEGVTKPILMHGPTALVFVDETGAYHDPVNETYPGLIRIAWYHMAYIADNQPPAPYKYDPLLYGQGTGNWSFIGYAAEYWDKYNSVITVAGESLYGDYEPAWASSYYGVELDGPKFVTNLVAWWVKIITYRRTEVFSFSDPEGDDNGIGTLKYPTNPVFKPGVFDLLKFQVFTDDNYVYFRATFKNLGGNPWNGPNGFSLQHLQIYVLTTAKLAVNKTAPGLNVEINPGWHYLIVAIPGWGDTPWPDGEVSAIYSSTGSLVAKQGDKFSVYAVPGEAIEVKVDKSLLTDVDNIEKWGFVVAVASYDGYGSYKVRGVVAGDPQEWLFGGADSLALLAGVHPLIIDLLAPTANEQYKMLKSYDATAKKLAVVSVLGAAPPTVTTTVTSTVTVTTTSEITKTTERVVTTVVPTTVPTIVPTTVPITVSTTVSTTVTQTEMTTTVVTGILALIIGLIIGYAVKKPSPKK
jgi:carbohydrate-binding DOMON domain-containing protein